MPRTNCAEVARPVASRSAVKRFGHRWPADPFDVELAAAFVRPVQRRLAEHDHAGIGFQPQPVFARLGIAAGDDLHLAIRPPFDIAIEQLPGRMGAAVNMVSHRVGDDGEIEHRPALAGDAVVACPPDRGIPIDIVGIVRANLRGFVAEFVEEGEVGVARLDILFQRELGEAREIAETLGPDQRIIGHIRRKDDLARIGQLGAEFPPGLRRIAHAATQSPPFTSSIAPVISLA